MKKSNARRKVVKGTRAIIQPSKVVAKQLQLTPARLWKLSTKLLRTDPVGVRTGLASLIFATFAGLVAGLVLGSITDTLEALPGLLVLAPASIGLRGNVFGALASRLSTLAHMGELQFTRKLKTPFGQNLQSAIALSIGTSLVLAFIAKIVAEAFVGEEIITFSEFFVISIIGSLIPTAVLLAVTVFLARLSVKRSWDLDNVGAPIITATGDMVTIPSLVLATFFVGKGWFSGISVFLALFAAISVIVLSYISKQKILRQIVKESFPMLIALGSISILAGITIEGKLESFLVYPILIVLIPPLLSTNGAIGSVLSARIATKLHLGLVRPKKFSFSAISEDVTVAYLLCVPVFLLLGIACYVLGIVFALSSPSFLTLMGIALTAGILSTTISNIVGYFTAVITYGFGLDPDNFAVPSVTSISDFIGAIVLITTIGVFGI